MLKLPEEYKKYDDRVYYLVFHWSSKDSEGFKELESCTIFKDIEKAKSKANNEGCFDRKVIEGTIKELAQKLRKELSKSDIKFNGLRNKEKELFGAYYNCFIAKDLNNAHIARIRAKGRKKRMYEAAKRRLDFIKNEIKVLVDKNKTDTKKFKRLQKEKTSTEIEIRRLEGII